MRKQEFVKTDATMLYMKQWVRQILVRKKKFLGWLGCGMLMMAFSISSCSKSGETKSNDVLDEQVMVARDWFRSEVVRTEREFLMLKKWKTREDTLRRVFARMNKMEPLVEWTKAEGYVENGWNYVIAPIATLKRSFANPKFNGYRALVIFTRPDGRVDMQVVELLARPGELVEIKELVRAGFLRRYLQADAGFKQVNAEMLFYDRNYLHQQSLRLVNGRWENSSFFIRLSVGPVGKNRIMSTLAASTSCSTCTTWYLVGFWYDTQTGQVDDYAILTQWEECEVKDNGEPAYGDGETPTSGSNECIQKCMEEGSDFGSDAYTVSDQYSEEVTRETSLRKTVLLRWRILKALTWSIYSYETGIKKRVRTTGAYQWVWESITHNRVGLEGITPGGKITPKNDIGVPSFTPGTPNVLYGGMQVDYDVEYAPGCPTCVGGVGLSLGTTINHYQSGAIWAANP